MPSSIFGLSPSGPPEPEEGKSVAAAVVVVVVVVAEDEDVMRSNCLSISETRPCIESENEENDESERQDRETE